MEKICERHNVPHTVKLLGSVVDINFIDGLHENDDDSAWGITHIGADPITISIDANASARMTYRTLIHEILEVINSEMGLCIKHSKIEALELGLADVLLNNDIDWGYVNGSANQ